MTYLRFLLEALALLLVPCSCESTVSIVSELRSLTPESHVSYSPSDWLEAAFSAWPMECLSESASEGSSERSTDVATPLSASKTNHNHLSTI